MCTCRTVPAHWRVGVNRLYNQVPTNQYNACPFSGQGPGNTYTACDGCGYKMYIRGCGNIGDIFKRLIAQALLPQWRPTTRGGATCVQINSGRPYISVYLREARGAGAGKEFGKAPGAGLGGEVLANWAGTGNCGILDSLLTKSFQIMMVFKTFAVIYMYRGGHWGSLEGGVIAVGS